jgi:hypothetical protein
MTPTPAAQKLMKAAEEGDLAIGAGSRKTMTLHLTPDEIAVLEKLVNPEAAELRGALSAAEARIAELEKDKHAALTMIAMLEKQLAGKE